MTARIFFAGACAVLLAACGGSGDAPGEGNEARAAQTETPTASVSTAEFVDACLQDKATRLAEAEARGLVIANNLANQNEDTCGCVYDSLDRGLRAELVRQFESGLKEMDTPMGNPSFLPAYEANDPDLEAYDASLECVWS